jgi:hypothetical protein
MNGLVAAWVLELPHRGVVRQQGELVSDHAIGLRVERQVGERATRIESLGGGVGRASGLPRPLRDQTEY